MLESGRRRRGATRRTSTRPALTLQRLLLALAILTVAYLYQQGAFDRWLGSPQAAPPAAGPVPKGDGPSTTTDPQQQRPAPQVVETGALAGFANGNVQVYFTRPRYPETPRGRSGGLDETLAADIDRAQNTVDLAFFDFDLGAVATALIRAQERGVRVRAVIDGENLETPEVAALAGEMQQAGIPITFDRREAFMHNKFVVIDDAVLWTGSWNATINDTFRNNNNMLRFADKRIADNYTRKFELLFAGHGGPGDPASLRYSVVDVGEYRVETAFSPDSDITTKVVRAIQDAQASVDVLAFTFTSDPIANALVAAHERGVAVRGVIERRNARASGTELPKLKQAGLDMHEDGNCYIMHHKVFMIDGRMVITGSFNWTGPAQTANDENVVIVDNSWLAERYAAEFTRIYDQALNPTCCGG